MRQEDIIKLLREQPFRAFRVHLSNGDVHEIRHPELVLVSRSTMILALPAAALPSPAMDDYVTISLIHINKADFVAPSSPTPSANN
jgi:hypothetical protein